MKKHNLRGKCVFGVIIALGIFFINDNVYAETISMDENTLKLVDEQKEYCTGISDNTIKKNCQNAVNSCKNILTSEVTKYRISINVDSNHVLTYNVDGMHSNITKNMVAKKDNNVIASGTKINDKYDNIQFTADLSATKSYSGDGGTPISCTGTFEFDYNYNSTTPEQETFENPACKTNGICRKYLNGNKLGKYKIGGKEYDLDTSFSYKELNKLGRLSTNENFSEYFKKYLPYCDCDGAGKYVSDIYNDDYIKSQITELASTFETNRNIDTTINNRNVERLNLEGIEVTDVKQSFTCDAFNSGKNTHTFYKKQPVEPVYYDNYMNGSENPERVRVCDVTCAEVVTVTYGPPVAAKGSACFEYEIEVKSKTICETDYNNNAQRPTPPTRRRTCQMSIDCNSYSGVVGMQAGPNEDFDDCVTKEFNGKYTQKAINYCYNKVYKNNKTKKVSYDYENELLPQKMADDSSRNITIKINGVNKTIDYCKTDDMKLIANIHNYDERVKALDEVAEKLYHSATTASSGKYIKNENVIYNGYQTYRWNGNRNGCYWNKYADVYKRSLNVAKSLVYDDILFARGNGFTSEDKTEYYKLRQRMYGNSVNSRLAEISEYDTIDVNQPSNIQSGTKRAHYINTDGNCHDTCYMYTKDSNCDLPGTSSNYDEEYRRYRQSLDSYNQAQLECNARIECNQQTRTYKMTVNNEIGNVDICDTGLSGQKGRNDKSCTSWMNKNTNQMVEKITKDGQILKYAKGICYNNSETENGYHDIISFPGSWERDKDGSIRYTKPKNINGYTEHKNKYCVSPDAANVNVDWWTWDQCDNRSQEGISGVNVRTATNTLGIEYNRYNGKYNIYGKMEKFGYFNWELDFSCFYAIYDKDCPECIDCPRSGDDGDDDDDKTNTNGLKNSDTRTIDLKDPFPAAEGVANKTSDEEIIPKKLNNTATEEKVTKVTDSSLATGRTPGFNWSCDATNLNIEGYAIAPTVLTKKIKVNGESIYDVNSGELDYEIEITPEQIKKIRDYNEDKDYFTFSGNKESISFNNRNDSSKKFDIIFYKSSFLKNYTSVKNYPKKKCNNLKNNGTECDNLDELIDQEQACFKVINER